MAAIDRLTTALASASNALDRNTAAVTKLEEEWNKPNPTEEQVDVAAGIVEAQTARLNDLSVRVESLTAPAPGA